jgi:hypothetical protein
MVTRSKVHANNLVQRKNIASCMIRGLELVLVALIILLPKFAFAAGGLDSATDGVNTFKIWLYTFLGVCASCVLMWKGAECWADRSHWSEFVTLGGKVAVVGAVVGVLAPYLWNLFA